MSTTVVSRPSHAADAPPTASTILVIEDDPQIAITLTTVLEGCGYRTLHAATSADAAALLAQAHPDLIILDLVLPDKDGLLLTPALCGVTRAPILICSARNTQVDRVLGLKLGAADFLAKPFDVDELLARVEALLRRSPNAAQRVDRDIQVGDLVISPKRGAAVLAGQPLRLTPTEYRLLLVLASQPDVVFPRALLAERLWGYHDESCNHTVDVHLGRLRSKLRAIQPSTSYIVAIRGQGFRLAR
jgi:DNA-binding response OmpR family regulator